MSAVYVCHSLLTQSSKTTKPVIHWRHNFLVLHKYVFNFWLLDPLVDRLSPAKIQTRANNIQTCKYDERYEIKQKHVAIYSDYNNNVYKGCNLINLSTYCATW